MTAEARLLIACCRRFLHTNSSEDLGELVNGVNWDAVLELADVHAVTPLVYSALKQGNLAVIPDALSARFQANARNNLTLTAELLKILALLASDRITAIPLKGPILALQAYGDLSLRTFSDLDLLVSQGDVPHAWRLLTGAGYRMTWVLPSSAESAYLKIKERQLSFVQSNGSSGVDLHWGLLPDYCGGASACEDALNSAKSMTFGGQSFPILSSEDQLLYLCAHGGKHLWTRLGWICDVAGVIRSRPEMDWSRTLTKAVRFKAEVTLFVGLLLATDLLGVSLPEEVVRSMRSEPAAGGLARDMQTRMFSKTPVGFTPLEACRANLRMIHGAANRLRYFNGIFIAPGEAEFRLLSLPLWLYPLYYPFRMARIAAKYALGKR